MGNTLRQHAERIEGLQQTIDQQTATIKYQSRTIAGKPHTSAESPSLATPGHKGAIQGPEATLGGPPVTRQSRASDEPPPPFNTKPPTQELAVQEALDASASDFAGQLQHTFSQVEQWAWRYTKSPAARQGVQLPRALRSDLDAVLGLGRAPAFLGDASTRHLLAARLINGSLAREVMNVGVLVGFASDYDQRVKELRGPVYQGKHIIATRP